MNYQKDKVISFILVYIITAIAFVSILAFTVGFIFIIKEIGIKSNYNITYNISIVEQTSKYEIKTKPKDKPKDEIKTKPKESKKVEKVETDIIDKDTHLLAQIINAEAKGEPYNGKVAVGNVILNRIKSPHFPDTVRDVVYQKGQFSPVSDGSINNEPNSESIKAAKEAMNGYKVVGDDVIYFYNPHTSTSDWIFSREVVYKIGNHAFAM